MKCWCCDRPATKFWCEEHSFTKPNEYTAYCDKHWRYKRQRDNSLPSSMIHGHEIDRDKYACIMIREVMSA